MATKNSFNLERTKTAILDRLKMATDRALSDAVADIQIRLDSGRGINGESYRYSDQTAKKKGKASPVDWADTGTLRRSIDFKSEILKDKIKGLIGVKDLPRGLTTNKVILQSLIDRFPGMWGLSKAEVNRLYTNLIKYFKA